MKSPMTDSLRDKIAYEIYVGYADGKSTLPEIADAILAIPEIRDAQQRIAELEAKVDRLLDQLVEEGERD